MNPFTLKSQVTLRSEQPPHALLARAREHLEPLEGRWPLVFKLSPGGIVLQVLRAPQSPQPLWGRVDAQNWELAQLRRSQDLSPFQPLLQAELHADGEGSRLVGTLAPHPRIHSWSAVYAVVGILLLATAALQAPEPLYRGALAFMGLAFVFFPQLRAWHGCSSGRQELLLSLERHLGLREVVSKTQG